MVGIGRRMGAEVLGTFWLVFGGCGSAVLAAAFPHVGIGLLGVAFAFGLTVLTMAYAIGHISGCHLNPAVTMGLATAKRFPMADVPKYVVAQCAGGVLGAGVLYVIASGAPGFSLAGGFACNGFAEHSPGGYSMMAALVTEVVLDVHVPRHHPRRHAREQVPARLRAHPHRVRPRRSSISSASRVTNLSVNPARSPALRSSSADGRYRSSGSSGSRPSRAPCSPVSSTPP